MRILALSFFSLLWMTSLLAQRDVVDIALNSKDHKTLVAAVQAADLVETLRGEGPFTIFAPTDEAFDKLPEGTLNTLLKPENKDQLRQVLTYHLLAGSFEAADVLEAIRENGNRAVFETVEGGELTATIREDAVYFRDEQGNESMLLVTNLKGANGMVHVIDGVLLPK